MITLERTRDMELVRQIVTHPSVYGRSSDDSAPPPDKFMPVDSEAVYWIVARDDGELLGAWMLHPHNMICYEIHTCLWPCAYGPRALIAADGVRKWIWNNTPCRRIITNVPEDNRIALRFALRAGMKVFGFNEKSIMKHGEVIGQVMLGISAGEGE